MFIPNLRNLPKSNQRFGNIEMFVTVRSGCTLSSFIDKKFFIFFFLLQLSFLPVAPPAGEAVL